MGFCLGTANIIPGVSGGTFLLVFNIYERVFGILNRINRAVTVQFAGHLAGLIRNAGTRGSTGALLRFLGEHDFIFLIKLLIGAAAAILLLSSLMKYLLLHHFSLTYALFFGLILVSILIPVKLLKSRKMWQVFFILAGGGLTILVSGLVNPYDKVKMKSDHYRLQYEQTAAFSRGDGTHEKPAAGILAFTGKYTLKEYVYAGVCGAVSISAMVLPGISGSLVLILMGTYFDVISAISALRHLHPDTLAFLACFGLGIVAGGLLFARLISYFLKKYYDATMAFLIGLMAGSLYALWPFKKVMVMPRQYVKQEGVISVIENARIYTNINVFPAPDAHLVAALLFFGIGCMVMVGFMRFETQGS